MTSLFRTSSDGAGAARKSVTGAKHKAKTKSKGPTLNSPVDQLTEDQLDEFREAFNTFDEDGGGTIDKDELRKLLTFAGQTPSDDELRDMIQIIDADGTGDINFPEFVTLMAHKMANEASEETIEHAFNVFDTDGSGAIAAAEFMRVLRNLGEMDISVEDIQDVFASKYGRTLGDTNGDGVISYQEFRKVILADKQGGVSGDAAYLKAVNVDGQHGQLGYGKMVNN
eukprot:CAMPEP_0115844460 /NCGR_PEP_ID=MMETSP0287-20121206/8839_1 /TAXON_ID=412157 /ORGANISM="Chrysochromulina rotalis, Strain UIO044" /LENGTH=225 /DNA_ID=CAMNT_0003298185 /DNA_START=48 /DNA_END=725 /DNA_ORIENTATION=+